MNRKKLVIGIKNSKNPSGICFNFPLGRKGQISMFIILGIIILVGVALMIYLRGAGIEKEEEAAAKRLANIPLELRPLYSYVDNCIKDIAESGIMLLGVQGGYIYRWDKTLETNYSSIAYGYYERKDVLPSLEFIKSEIDAHLNSSIGSCVNNSMFPDLEISTGAIANEIDILPDSVDIKVDYGVKAEKGDFVGELGEFFIKIPVRLGYSYYAAEQIIKKQIEDPDYIDMTFLSGFDADVSIIPHNSSELVYSVTDNRSGRPFTFLFGAKFIVNKAPILSVPDSLALEDSVPFIYQITADDPENDELIFSDDTAMFDITEDGVILFTPEVTGEFDVKITVQDVKGNYDKKDIKFLVR